MFKKSIGPIVRIRMPDFRKINEAYQRKLEEAKGNEYTFRLI